MVLGVVLELLGRYRGAEEVLQVLKDVLLGRREGARLRLRIETCFAHDKNTTVCLFFICKMHLSN